MSKHNEKRHHQLDRLFQQALTLPVDKRIAYLISVTSDDPTLIDDVKKLLQYHDESEEFLGDTISDFLYPLYPILQGDETDTDFTFEAGTFIGNYRIVSLIGKGGMGQVYLAIRDDGVFTKQVALKCLKKGMDSEEILKRFRYERQILATLQHPHIASLLDGGVSDDGRPFFIMEYVNGIPIDKYCNQNKLSVADRLRLFKTVCEAVQYAHQKLIVHRDLKPSNILVTNQGEVKLLDFGIARLLDDENPFFTAPVTRTGFRLLTPEYAAPEQLKNEQITTATDVFSLGMLLLELLTGLVSVIDRKKQERPSQLVLKKTVFHEKSVNSVTSQTIASNRSTTTGKLSRELQGDLDTIILTALKDDPSDRYNSAEMLMADINNYLRGLPVTARPDTPAYRMRKFVHRHRGSVAAASLFIMVLFLFAILASIQQTRTESALRIAEYERAAAGEVAAFLENLFSAANPLTPTSERLDTMRVRDLLVRGEERLHSEFTDQPAIHARMLSVIGRTYRSLGDPERAILLLEDALSIYRSLQGDWREEISQGLNVLANAYMDSGNDVESERLHREVLAIRQILYPGDHPDKVMTLNNLGSTLQNQGKFDEARLFYDDALAMVRRLPEPDSLAFADILNTNAAFAYRQNDVETAISLTRESISINQALVGYEHPRIGREMNNLAFLLNHSGQREEAISIYREVLQLNRNLLGEEHPFVIMTMGNLADALSSEGIHEEASVLFEKAIDMQRSKYTTESPEFSVLLGNYASLLNKKSEYTEAEKLYREALDIDQRLFGEGHMRVGVIKNKLGVVLCRAGSQDEGEWLTRDGLLVLEQFFPPDHPRITDAKIGLEACASGVNPQEASLENY